MSLGLPESHIATVFSFGHRTTIASNTSTYLPGTGGTNQAAEISLVIPQDGILKNLTWDCQTNGLTGVGNRFTVQVGPVHPTAVAPQPALAAALVVSIDGKTNAAVPMNVPVTAGQRVGVQVQTVAGGTNVSRLRVSFELEVQRTSPTWQLAADNSTVFYDGGNVGIGTTAPTAPLSVNGIIESKAGGLKFPDGSVQIKAAPSLSSLDGPGGSPSQALVVDNAGRVGIGTSTPRAGLEVVGEAIVSNSLSVGAISVGGSPVSYAGCISAAFRVTGAWLEAQYGITVGGSAARVEGGSIWARDAISCNGSIWANSISANAVSAPSITTCGAYMRNFFANYGYIEYAGAGALWGVSMWASSRKFKDDIVPLEFDSSTIYDLQPVSFNWKPNRGGQRTFGLIAEDVERINPYLVNHDEEGKPFSVRYELLAVLLLNELKKKSVQLDSLEQKLADLPVRSGSDFAEYFESTDGKRLDVATAVVLEKGKIRAAKSGEVPMGVISSNPAMVGGLYLEWHGKFERDAFGALVMEDHPEEVMEIQTRKVKKERQKQEKKIVAEETKPQVVFKNGKACQVETTGTVTKEVESPVFEEVDLYDADGKTVIGKHKIPVMEKYEEEVTVFDGKGNPVRAGTGKFVTLQRPKVSSAYDSSRQYIPRHSRPEWNCVGLLGQVHLRKGQPTAPGWFKLRDVSDQVELWLVK